MTSRATNGSVGPVWGGARGFDPSTILITLAGLVLGLFCLVHGFPFYGDDSTSHAISYSHFASHLWQGDLYPRWIPTMNGGLGSAFFFYYPPVPYYLTSVLHPAFPSDSFGWHQLGIGATAALIASGLILYIWLNPLVGRTASLISALVYMLLPYHLNIDLYTRGAYAELWAFVWMPLVLLSIDWVSKRRKFGVVGLSLSYALLVMTHLPSAVIFSLVPVAYSLVQAEKNRRIRVFSLTVAGMGIGIGLSSIYLVPALALQRFSFQFNANTGHYFYGNWFLFTGLNRSTNSTLFWFTLEVAALALLAFVVVRAGAVVMNKVATFWFVIVIVTIVMMSPISGVVWRAVPTLQQVQFPWRFNVVLSLASAVLLAIAFTSRPRRAPRLVLQLALVLLMGIWSYDAFHRGWNAYPVHYIDQAVVNERNVWLDQSRDQNEYRPRWVVSIRETDLNELLQRLGKTPEMAGTAALNGPGTVRITNWQRKGISLEVNATEPAVVEVSQFYFPGWEARLDNAGNLDVNPSIPGGLVAVSVPAGSHQVLLRRVSTRPERLGQLISAASLMLLLSLYGRALLRRSENNDEHEGR